MYRKFYLLAIVLAPIYLLGQIPQGYYNNAVGKKKEELKTALHHIIKDANVLSYGSGAGATWSGFAKTDVREDGTVWDMYSDIRVPVNGNSAASGMNIEHSLAKSWWGRTKNQAYKDLFHLNPSNSRANSARGSWPMAIVNGKETFNNGVIKVGKSSSRPGGEIDAWEPADEYKGDFARAYMYMVTCYEDFANIWTGNSVNQFDNNTYPVFEQWTIDLLLEWCKQDPVSTKEINRNNEIYKIQGNRNPYIDYPLMAEYVWGSLADQPFTPDGNVDYSYLSTPSNNSEVNFGKVAYLTEGYATIQVKGVNLKDDVSITLSGINASDFALDGPTIIDKDEVNNGYELFVSFSAYASLGEKTAIIEISSNDFATIKVNLKAIVTDEFMALSASNISTTSFNANWNISANATGYILDVYSKQSDGEKESVTLVEEDFNSGMPSSWSKSGYTDVTSLIGSVRLGSGSQNGAITSPAVDLADKPAILTVQAKHYNNDKGADLTVRLDDQEIAVWETNGEFELFEVDLPAATNASKITLSAVKGERVYIDFVKISTQGAVFKPVSNSGYPKTLGNVLTYTVTGLEQDSTYYYTVTPIGNGITISNTVEVKTLKDGGSGIEDVVSSTPTIRWYNTKEGIYVISDETEYTVNIFDSLGRVLGKTKSSISKTFIPIKENGFYLLQIVHGDKVKTVKILHR